MACALTTTAAYWHKVKQLQALGMEVDGGFAMQKLERSVLDGADLGTRCLSGLSSGNPKEARAL